MRIATLSLPLFLLVLAACSSSSANTKDAGAKMSMPSLYERLGGEGAVTAVVDQFVGNVAADTRINGRFAQTNIPHLKKMLVDQIGSATGGPMKYTGKDMKSAHRGMAITEAEFGALVEDLVAALDKFKVPQREKNELLGILGPMKPEIVGQ